MTRLLLCTDLDRTLLPNGAEPESPGARETFSRFVSNAPVILVYATGRDRRLVEQVLGEYGLPLPDYVIGDVGTTVHELDDATWRPWPAWSEHIAADWRGLTGEDVAAMIPEHPALTLQEAHKQNDYKLSFYVDLDADRGGLEKRIEAALRAARLSSNLVWSIDEPAGVGLLDILPARAGKLQALDFLHQVLCIPYTDTLFAGDSGNDLPVLASPIPSVLVANASPEVARQALAAARRAGTIELLYLAHGGFLGMNGNYAAGILEGIAHFHPDMIDHLNGDHGQ